MNRFIPEFEAYLENAVSVDKDSNGNMVVTRPGAKYLIIDQDEKVHHSNDIEKL